MRGIKLQKRWMLLATAGLLTLGMGLPVAAQELTEDVIAEEMQDVEILKEGNILQGNGGGYTWVLEESGKLIVRDEEGAYNLGSMFNSLRWNENKVLELDMDVSYANFGYSNGNFAEFQNLQKATVKIDTCEGSMASLFSGCINLEELNLSIQDTSGVTSMRALFNNCKKLTGVNVANFDTSEVVDMSYMFSNCGNLTELDVTNFNTSKVTDMHDMFSGCSKLTALDVSKFDTSNVTQMWNMFHGCSELTELDVSNFNTSNVISMSSTFAECTNLTSLDVSKFDTSNVTDMTNLFRNCNSLTKLDVTNFDTSNVTNMMDMFHGCSSLEALDVSKFDTGNVTNMYRMFFQCEKVKELDVSKFNTSKTNNVSEMFTDCKAIQILDLSGFGGHYYEYGDFLIYSCINLWKIYSPVKYKNYTALPNNGEWIRTDTQSTATEILTNMEESVLLLNVTREAELTPHFDDVQEGGWKYSFVRYVYDEGIMTGKGTTEDGKIVFAPDDYLTRAELAQMLYSMESKPTVEYAATFGDVKSTDWFRYSVLWANENGIATGVGDNKFNPTGKITREQVATMLKKYALLKSYDTEASADLSTFTDASTVSSWAVNNISWAVGKGVISGKAVGDGTLKLDPKGNATRAECAAMIKSFCEKVAGN